MTGSGTPKAALVTGGAKRLGRVIVEGLAEDGWAVAIHYGTSADEAEALAEAITRNGGTAVTVLSSDDPVRVYERRHARGGWFERGRG